MAELCNICVEPFNKTNRKQFISPCCPEFIVCRGCIGTWVMGSAQAPSCMTCKVPYAIATLEAGFTKKFMNEIHEAQADLFKESQRALLPQTQPLVEGLNELDTLQQEILDIKADTRRLAERKRVIERRMYDIRNLRNTAREVDNDYQTIPDELRGHSDEAGRKFTMACSHNDCRGFVSSRYKCGLCEKYTCSRCQKPKDAEDDPEHICDDNDVLSVAEIKRHTKPCPKCSARIHKISGCSQMFCTALGCGTIFDWNTGRIQTRGVEHNPHIAAWRERFGITQRNGQCDGPLRESQVTAVFNILTGDRRWGRVKGNNELALIMATRARNHLEDVDIRRIEADNQHWKLLRLRINYLQNNLTDEKWTREIKTLHRSVRRRDEYMLILNGLCELYDGLIREQLQNAEDQREVDMSMVYELSKITQDGLNEISKRYNVIGFQLPMYLRLPIEA